MSSSVRLLAVYSGAAVICIALVAVPLAFVSTLLLPKEAASIVSFILGTLAGALPGPLVLYRFRRVYRWVYGL